MAKAKALADLGDTDLIEQLARSSAEQEPTMTLTAFHERLLATGPVALPLVVQRAFGSKQWQAAIEQVLK